MTRCELEDSIWKLIPLFFPEISKQETNSYVFIDARSNFLLLTITFYKPKVASKFDARLQKLNLFLSDAGIHPVSEAIMPHYFNPEKEEETYYYQIPLSLAQGFAE